MVNPGRLTTVGTESDLADGGALLAILRVTGETRTRRTAGSMHIAREALWSFWERPRLPKPLVGNKYPVSYPWSPKARAVYQQHQGRPVGGFGLVLEHLTPRNLLIMDLWQRIEHLDEQELMQHLMTHLVGTIITKEEDAALTAAGVARSVPLDADPQDVWGRYRIAGLVPEDFAPIAPASA